MDQSLWQTLGSFDLLHSSHKWIPTILLCGNTAQHRRLGLFQGSDFAGDLEDSKSTLGGILCIFGSRTFVPKSWTVGCVRDKLQSLTVPPNLKLFRWKPVFAWTVSPLSISGFYLSKYCTLLKNIPVQGNLLRDKEKQENAPTPKRRNTPTETILNHSMWITLSQTQNLLTSKPCFSLLKTVKQWSRWLLKSEVRRWDTCPEPTESR